MWNTPSWRWEKPLDDRMAMSGLGGWDSGDRPADLCHTWKKNKALEIWGGAETIQTTALLRCQNTEKSPGDLKRLAVTQTPASNPLANAGVKNSQMSKITVIISNRLYVLRNERGRGLTSIEDSVDALIQRLEDYIQKTRWRTHYSHRETIPDNTMDNRVTITRKQKWEGKQLYGRFKRLINNISHDKTWTWLRKEKL